MVKFYEIPDIFGKEGSKSRLFPSVTTILSYLPKPELQAWRETVENPDEIMKTRAIEGTLFHYRVLSYLAKKGGLPPIALSLENKPKIDTNLIQKIDLMHSYFLDWVEQYNPKPLCIETMCVNYDMKYAGTVDLVAEINKTAWVIDLKTSQRIYDVFHAQVTAYSRCIIDGLLMHTGKKKLGILCVNELGYQFEEVDEVLGWDIFLEAFKCFKRSGCRI